MLRVCVCVCVCVCACVGGWVGVVFLPNCYFVPSFFALSCSPIFTAAITISLCGVFHVFCYLLLFHCWRLKRFNNCLPCEGQRLFLLPSSEDISEALGGVT